MFHLEKLPKWYYDTMGGIIILFIGENKPTTEDVALLMSVPHLTPHGWE